GSKQITLTSEQVATDTEKPTSKKTEFKYDTSKKITEQKPEQQSFVAKIGMGAGKVVATFNQSGREGVQTMINTVIPFMAFVSLLI
ncbi:PTS glucitol/sorbitol transporter subunit IIB, partial [Enterococcus faecalis]